MPKKIIFSSLIISFLSFIVRILTISSLAYANFEEEYQKYLQINDVYREKHAAYLIARGEYMTYGTLTAKNNALNAVKEMMIARDDVLLQHYQLLRQKYISYTLYQPLLNTDEKFVTDHKASISAIADLDDAVAISAKLEKQHISLQINSRKIVGAILYAKLEELKNKVMQTEASAQSIIFHLKSENKDVANLERWLLDAQSKRAQAEIKQQEVNNQITEFRATNLENISKDFNQILLGIAEANQYLKESINYLNELKESIKYGNY